MATAMLSVLLGTIIGLSLGMLGGGGSILTVPALVYLVGLPVADATGTSLAIVAITALIGAVGHHRANRVALRTAAGFGAAGMAGSVVGSLLGRRVDGSLLLLLFALLMIAAGLSMLRQGGFDAVVSDIEMPVMDGHALARAVRADAVLARTPLLALTTLNTPESRASAAASGFDEYEVKLDRDSLLAKVSALLQRRRVT